MREIHGQIHIISLRGNWIVSFEINKNVVDAVNLSMMNQRTHTPELHTQRLVYR